MGEWQLLLHGVWEGKRAGDGRGLKSVMCGRVSAVGQRLRKGRPACRGAGPAPAEPAVSWRARWALVALAPGPCSGTLFPCLLPSLVLAAPEMGRGRRTGLNAGVRHPLGSALLGPQQQSRPGWKAAHNGLPPGPARISAAPPPRPHR